MIYIPQKEPEFCGGAEMKFLSMKMTNQFSDQVEQKAQVLVEIHSEIGQPFEASSINEFIKSDPQIIRMVMNYTLCNHNRVSIQSQSQLRISLIIYPLNSIPYILTHTIKLAQTLFAAYNHTHPSLNQNSLPLPICDHPSIYKLQKGPSLRNTPKLLLAACCQPTVAFKRQQNNELSPACSIPSGVSIHLNMWQNYHHLLASCKKRAPWRQHYKDNQDNYRGKIVVENGWEVRKRYRNGRVSLDINLRMLHCVLIVISIKLDWNLISPQLLPAILVKIFFTFELYHQLILIELILKLVTQYDVALGTEVKKRWIYQWKQGLRLLRYKLSRLSKGNLIDRILNIAADLISRSLSNQVKIISHQVFTSVHASASTAFCPDFRLAQPSRCLNCGLFSKKLSVQLYQKDDGADSYMIDCPAG